MDLIKSFSPDLLNWLSDTFIISTPLYKGQQVAFTVAGRDGILGLRVRNDFLCLVKVVQLQDHLGLLYNEFCGMELERSSMLWKWRSDVDLHGVEEVEDHLQDWAQDNTHSPGHHEGDDGHVRIVFLSSSSDGLQEEMVSFDDVGSFTEQRL